MRNGKVRIKQFTLRHIQQYMSQVFGDTKAGENVKTTSRSIIRKGENLRLTQEIYQKAQKSSRKHKHTREYTQ